MVAIGTAISHEALDQHFHHHLSITTMPDFMTGFPKRKRLTSKRIMVAFTTDRSYFSEFSLHDMNQPWGVIIQVFRICSAWPIIQQIG
jgi:hypothetical protein